MAAVPTQLEKENTAAFLELLIVLFSPPWFLHAADSALASFGRQEVVKSTGKPQERVFDQGGRLIWGELDRRICGELAGLHF